MKKDKNIILETILGLEIHLEIETESKLFCDCPNQYLINQPNTNICPICTGQPGTLPVLNLRALEQILTLGLALNGHIVDKCGFDRKNYYYPDLPKGYQISQYDLPLIQGGEVLIDFLNNPKKIYLERIHLEEDTAKLFHSPDKKNSYLDFNRSGLPLLEIVTKPWIGNPKQAKAFLQELQIIIRYLGISQAEMEKGQLRCDANISLRQIGEQKYYPKTEIKNLNSFKAVQDALEYEIKYQTKLWQENKAPKRQSTKGWDENKKQTILQREKEELADYRYFPEPDIPPLDLKIIDKKILDLNQMKKSILELPNQKRKRLSKEYGLKQEDIEVLIQKKERTAFFEQVVSELKAWLISLETVEGSEKEIWKNNGAQLAKLTANWTINHFLPLLKRSRRNNQKNKTKNNKKTENKAKNEAENGIKQKIEDYFITPENFAEFIILVYQNKLSNTLGKQILEQMIFNREDCDQVLKEFKNQAQEQEPDLEEIIEQVIQANPKEVKKYQDGNKNILQFLLGQAMKLSKGRLNPNKIKEKIEKRLK